MELTLNVVADVVMDEEALDKMMDQLSPDDLDRLAAILKAKAEDKRRAAVYAGALPF